MAHVREGDALYDAMTDGAPTVEQRFLQSMEVTQRRMLYAWTTDGKSKDAVPEPILLPADRRVQAQHKAAKAAREQQLVDQLRARQVELAARRAREEGASP